MYGDIIESTRERNKLANDLGDYATAELFRELLATLEEDGHRFEHSPEDGDFVLDEATR